MEGPAIYLRDRAVWQPRIMRAPHRLNYFPLTREAFVTSSGDEAGVAASGRRSSADAPQQLHVLAAQAGGVTSRLPGQLEVMTHRRLAQDDNLGACAVFNDTAGGGYADLPVDDTFGTTCETFDVFGTCRPDSCRCVCGARGARRYA